VSMRAVFVRPGLEGGLSIALFRWNPSGRSMSPLQIFLKSHSLRGLQIEPGACRQPNGRNRVRSSGIPETGSSLPPAPQPSLNRRISGASPA